MRPAVIIYSGEGDGPGNSEMFYGRMTARAINMRLNRERRGGDRWAFATINGERVETGIEVAYVLRGLS